MSGKEIGYLRVRFLLSNNRDLRVRCFGKIRDQIIDPRSLGSRCIKETEESFPRVDS